MAIQIKQSSSNRISEPGEYVVEVIEVLKGTTKKTGKPMAIVTFETADKKLIRGYYVKDLTFHMDALADLKAACGLSKEVNSGHLLDCKLGIAVVKGKADPQGRVFMEIAGYGKTSDVEPTKSQSVHEELNQDSVSEEFASDDIPF